MAHKGPKCPRCAYDLSGQVAMWNHEQSGACPLDGFCSECGLEFKWADVLRQDHRPIAGFVEHSRLWLTPLTAWRTWSWTLLPGRFWRRVTIERPVRSARLALWVFLVLVAPCLLAGVPAMVVYWPGSFGRWLRAPISRQLSWLAMPWREFWIQRPGPPTADLVMNILGQWPLFVCAGLVASIVFPCVLVCLPVTRARAKVRTAHVLRAATYQLAWLAPVMSARAVQIACNGLGSYVSSLRMRRAVPIPGSPGGMMIPARPRDWTDALTDACMGLHDLVRGVAHGPATLWLAMLAVWWCWWWWATLRRGWRLREAALVWCVAMAPTLVALGIILSLHPEFLRPFL